MKNAIIFFGSSARHLLSYLVKISFGPQEYAVSKDTLIYLPKKKKKKKMVTNVICHTDMKVHVYLYLMCSTAI